ncbi:MAG: 1-deoxy-D-xylulose-5-phosphate synthase [Clostridium sp.]|nr:1-deoxy-D-xylulose-5-phosphate synthase [Clostridium sp.]MCM1399423.1 1-deoxy-D-xylulose-5-phosphate synthase [Clostridium sp.]MCM1459977.1 1-deoxy-D-xylulose-5-phosphate synthase [Bacteroides sp.]
MALLNKILKENDIKSIDKSDYDRLAYEIRQFLIDKVSRQGGHLASNLGCVELTMALHLVMTFPEDKLIFDVGHQAYTHKLLTGRKDAFDTLRTYGGMSGFPKTRESDCDVFNTGHSSTSISAAMGFAVARDLKGGTEKVAAVIGDGSLTGGMAYEAINCLAQTKTGCIIVINDNEMSIDKNVGGLSRYLNSIRVGTAYNELKTGVENSLLGTKAGEKVAKTIKRSKDTIKQFLVPGMFFEELGVTYVGPVDGHNVNEMVSTFRKAFKLNKPIIIHVKTKKGMGYRYAERHPDYFHGIAAFDQLTGRLLVKKECKTYTDIFAGYMVTMGEKHDKLVAVTAAMSIGTGLNRFQEQFPKRMFDVGIAEQHAVTFAAGLAAAGMLPVVAIYSSFLQRAYDQILHDVCLQGLHVIFAVDRSGIVGQDGETHQGIYDISFLSHMPNMTVMAPKNRYELERMMDFAISHDGPIAIKYPRGDAYKGLKEYDAPIEHGKSEVIFKGSRVAILACGNMVEEAVRLTGMLKAEGCEPTLINVRFVSNVDRELLADICRSHSVLVTMEENIIKGGYGELVDACILDEEIKTSGDFVHLNCGIDKGYVEQGSIKRLREELKIDAKSVFARIKAHLK